MSIRRTVSLEQADWGLGPPPAWVVPGEPDWEFATTSHPVAVLLNDQQHDVATGALSLRSVRRLQTPAAVQSLSQVAIDFDPASHRLVIHHLDLWRVGPDGQRERRELARRDLFLVRQREQQLERQILNGRVSLVALLEDVRVGDAIDVAWTVEPRESLPGLRFSSVFSWFWVEPVARASYRLALSAEHPVAWQIHGQPGSAAPAREEAEGGVTWRVERLDAMTLEPNAPPGDWIVAVLEVSEWGSWSEVARFLMGLWSEAFGEGAESVAAQARRVSADLPLALAVREVIRFVQNEIRYLAFDFGTGGGVTPAGAGTVLRRRFGDCKDKTVLLCALLRALGVEAWPLLVAPNWGPAIARAKPSTSVFSHSIVTYTLDGTRHFVDPTALGQGGDLGRRVVPPFPWGLELRPEAESLIPLPERLPAEFSALETFEIDRAGRNGWVEEVIRATGWAADETRLWIMQRGEEAFFKERSANLQRDFPALGAPQARSITDDADANAIELRARYPLPTWGPAGSPPPQRLIYGARWLGYAMPAISGPLQRRQSWTLRFPIKFLQRIVVRGDCVQQPKPQAPAKVEGQSFSYTCEVGVASKEVSIEYRLETKRRAVAAADWEPFRREVEQMHRSTSALVLTAPPAPNPAPRRSAPTSLARGVFASMFGLIVLARLWSSLGAPNAPPPASAAARIDGDLSRASRAANGGDYEQAALVIHDLRAVAAQRLDYQVLRADVELHSGDAGEARDAIAAVRRLDRDTVEADLLEADLHESLGEFEDVRVCLERALGAAPQDARVQRRLALLFERTGQPERARLAWEQVLARWKDDPEALFHHSLLLTRGGRQSDADSAMASVSEANPNSAGIQAALARYYLATARPGLALGPARQSARLARDDAAFVSLEVIALARAGRTSEALSLAERVAARFPAARAAQASVAITMANFGTRETAERVFRSWPGGAPDDPDGRAHYALFLARTGRAAEARAILEDTLRRFPGNGMVWHCYAQVLEAKGDANGGAAARQKAGQLLTEEQRIALFD